MDLKKLIRDVPDFPEQGILFKDITPLLQDPQALRRAVQDMASPYAATDVEVVASVESRGFIFGPLLAQELDAGFVPIRKPGKLPAETISQSYELEYGSDTIEVHADAVRPGQRVLMVDDLLATGGTMDAACQLIQRLGAEIVGVAMLIELCFLDGREKLASHQVHSVIKFEGQ